MRYSEEEKRTLVSLYYSGKTVAEICQEHQISRSTFYSWIQAYRPVESKNSTRTVTPKDFDSLLRRCEKQEQIIAVLKSIPAIANATTQEKLAVLEPFYGQFSVHALCEALDVPRGTFYNHIKRNKRDNSSYAKHREELRTAIQEIFEESRQTFGSEKICVVLHERGYRAGTTLVRELMSEMGLSSVSITSKRQWRKSSRCERKANILQRQFHAEVPNCVWVSDVSPYGSRIIKSIIALLIVSTTSGCAERQTCFTAFLTTYCPCSSNSETLAANSSRGMLSFSISFWRQLSLCSTLLLSKYEKSSFATDETIGIAKKIGLSNESVEAIGDAIFKAC